MPGPPGQPSRLLILTNDDGIDAPGIQALLDATAGLGRRQVVAPRDHMSNCSHAVTTDRGISIEARPSGHVAVAGTPADAVRLAFHHLADAAGWVLSGINAGANLGTDIVHSGTVAAVREAAIRGVPGIAVSHYLVRGRPVDWPRASVWASRIIESLLLEPPPPGAFWNVNLPHLEPGAPDPAPLLCEPDPSPLPLGYRLESGHARYEASYRDRERVPGHDVEACFGGRITISLILARPVGCTLQASGRLTKLWST